MPEPLAYAAWRTAVDPAAPRSSSKCGVPATVTLTSNTAVTSILLPATWKPDVGAVEVTDTPVNTGGSGGVAAVPLIRSSSAWLLLSAVHEVGGSASASPTTSSIVHPTDDVSSSSSVVTILVDVLLWYSLIK